MAAVRYIVGSIRIGIEFLRRAPYFEPETAPRNVYKVTLRFRGKSTSFTYGDSLNNTRRGVRPSPFDILDCVINDYHVPETFAEFCEKLGYDPDSRYGESLYKRCRVQARKLARLFTPGDIERIRRDLGSQS